MKKRRFDVKPRTGWRYEGWRACTDLIDPEGVPRWFRCLKCNEIVTHGLVRQGGCVCGNRRLQPARELTWWEIVQLKLGRFPLTEQERAAVRPLFGGAA